MLTVYKASAGSGKTFQLVLDYLKLLMDNPFSYKHILAVTFTNKATNEMKSRILEQLFLLANGQDSNYFEIIQKEKGLSKAIIQQKAKLVLKNILHDYNRFSVNTIDSFTQRVIKAFNRELGISPNFSVEIDDGMVLEEAVDRLLNKIHSDKNLRKWLIEFSNEKITDNKSQRIEEDIKQLGKELFNERFQVFFPENDNSLYTRPNLEKFGKSLNAIIHPFEATLKNLAKKCIAAISENGFTTDDFSYKLSGVAGFLKKYAEGNLAPAGKRVQDAAENAEKWFAKNHKQRAELLVLVENQLLPLLNEILAYYQHNSEKYLSAVAVKSQLRMLGILTDLREEIKNLLQEKSMLQISDSNLLLSKIIGESESPFVYEKIGNHFKHFMLDEFQDTSALQWNNFKPLISNSLAEGNSNLLVGDVKQSIYRWRNSDWKILAEQIDLDFPQNTPQKKNLDKNWRSEKNIILFNNAIIQQLKESFEKTLFSEYNSPEWDVLIDKFNAVYSDFNQEPGNRELPENGWINIDLLEKEEYELNSNQLLVDQVKSIQDKGIRAKDIAILIRKNREGTAIIESFLAASKLDENQKYNLSVLSNESMFLHASKAVLFVIYIVDLLINENDPIKRAAALNIWKTSLKPEFQRIGVVFSSYQNEKQIKLNFSESKEIDWQLDKSYESEFESELGEMMSKLKQRINFTSVEETIAEICGGFKLFKLVSEIPFLQTLIDKAAEIKNSISNDLSNFIFWWNEKGYKTSVNINEEVDSIRLITIHKSKGLEYRAVLIPDLNWDTSWTGNFAPTLWCSSREEPFNQLPLLPVKAGKQLENTFFSKPYFEEKASYYIDIINLVYVAFTRAKSVLFIHSIHTTKPGKSINSLLKYSLDKLSESEKFADCWNSDHTQFKFGDLKNIIVDKKEVNPETLSTYHYSDFTNKVKLRFSGEDFFMTDKNQKSIKNTGKIIHEILAEIETTKDIEKACLNALLNGKINKNELEEIKELLISKLDQKEVKHWFSGTYKVINERNVLTQQKILRPDRIMFSGNELIVVDYKTGNKKSENYKRQITSYAKTLKETGFKKVEGYLWYINQNEVEKVCEF